MNGTATPGLRRRVAAAVLVLTSVVLVGLFAFVNLTLSAKLRSDLRGRLLDRAGFAEVLQDRLSDQDLVNRLTGDGVTARLSTRGGEVIGAPTAPPDPGRSPGQAGPAQPGRPPRPAQPTDAVITTNGDLLTVTTPLRDGDLVLSASQADITATARRLLTLEAVGGASALAILAAALYGVLGLALRPLARMTTLASDIAGGARGRRLRPRQPHTDLGRTATAFDAMLDELETAVNDARTAEATLREFLSDASHELRTPVAGVSVSAELLLSAELAPDVREQTTAGLVSQSRRISRLLNDLLLSARLVEPGAALHLTPTDLSALVAQQTTQAQLLAPQLQISHVLPAGGAVRVLADEHRVGQILANLLDNARHATPAGGAVTVTLAEDDDTVTVAVEDTGRGVPARQRERIFDRFVRLDGRADGNGLGLAISRSVAEAHGGTLRCEPADNQNSLAGSRFVLVLPKQRQPVATGA